MREAERQKWIHSGKERRKENYIFNRECRDRIHDKISFVVAVVCLFLFKFHRLLRWQKLNLLPTSKSLYFKGYAKWLPSRVVVRRGVGSPVAKQLSLTISFHTKTRNQQGWGHSKHAQLKYILHFIITHSQPADPTKTILREGFSANTPLAALSDIKSLIILSWKE